MALSTSAEFEYLKVAPLRDKDCVFGYLRLCQQLLSSEERDILQTIIPQLVFFKVLAFFYRREGWECCSANIMYDELTGYLAWNGSSNDKFGSVYGSAEIDFGSNSVVNWEIKIHDFVRKIVIGLVECSSFQRPPAVFWKQSKNYVIYRDNGEMACSEETASNSSDGYGDGQVVRLEVNTKLRTIRFYTDDEDHGVVQRESGRLKDIINFKSRYRLAVALSGGSTCVEIVGFSQRQITT